MTTIRIFAAIAAAAMLGALAYGFVAGDFFADGAALWAIPWGRVTIIDVYAGVAVVAAVVIVRERSPIRWVPWLVALVVLGHLATAAYALWTLRRGDPRDAGTPYPTG
jgi:hypothetical protein